MNDSAARQAAQPVFFLPGGVMPAAAQYGALLHILGDEVQPILKDLEVYSGETPPPDYSLSLEVEALKRAMELAGLQEAHLVGYSGGGAAALAFTAAHPQMVKSLALFEPAVIPCQEWFREEAAHQAELDRVMALPPAEQMPQFVRIHLRPGVLQPPPPQGNPPAWMARRPAGLRALNAAFKMYDLDLESFRDFHRPVYLAIGSLSDAVEERKAQTLARVFPDFCMEIYEGRHHFDPPQRAEPERFARGLKDLWARA